ncbi:MAG TPA: glycosyltransferase family 39 protein [Terracidiphilus sp.]|nr:glycosyltransferase family 39 protein [Terracidiphilus sp.]
MRELVAPRMDRPFPLWMIFPVIFAALYASHYTLLRLPYYWDEAGYYIPAAWDFFRTGSLIPTTTLSTSHPPLESVYLALWWRLSGFSVEVTREAVLLVAALGLLAVWRLAMRLTGVASVAFWTVALTGLYPVWFAQSTLAQADIFAAACALWGLVYALPERDGEGVPKAWAAALWFTAAALCKETAVAIPLTLAAVSAWKGIRARRWAPWRDALWLATPALPLAGWYVWFHAKTGWWFGNPQFFRYNAEATLQPVRIVAALGYRVLHLTAHMNLFVPVLMTLAALMLDPRKTKDGRERAPICKAGRGRMLLLLGMNAVLFSVLGGALLTRYLLPMYPLVLLLAVATFYKRVPWWPALAAFCAGAFVLGLQVNPPYRFAPEDNLEYARVVRMDQAGIAELKARYPDATVLTAWPVTDELTKPELGYVRKPWDVEAIDDFTAAEVAKAAGEPGKYSAALVFSTKYDPPWLPWRLGPKEEKLDERYFDLHHDLPPGAIAERLGGKLVWEQRKAGMWIALIRFERQYVAAGQAAGQAGRAGR